MGNEEPPMPPMGGPEDGGMGQEDMPPMGGPEDGGMPPMDDGAPSEGGGDTQEIDDIFSQMDIEDKNAVIKYAKSMLDTDEGTDENGEDNEMGDEGMGEPPMNGGGEPMPMESRRYLKQRITEICNEVLSDRITKNDRKDKKLNNDRKTLYKNHSPFSGRFS